MKIGARIHAVTGVATIVVLSSCAGPEASPPVITFEPYEFEADDGTIVENGGHNVYMQEPVISEIVLAFMRGEEVPERVTLSVPRFVVAPGG
jgi:hypothetical protein